MDKPTRVIITDDHDVVRRSLSLLLSTIPDITVVGEASSGREAIELCDSLQPDLVLMDLVMQEMDGLAATREIRARYPHVRVVVLTSFPEEGMRHSVLDAGASSILLKNAVSISELTFALQRATRPCST